MTQTSLNPYAPPNTASKLPQPVSDVLVDGHYLVVTTGARLPNRCVLTNEFAEEAERRVYTFEWSRPFHLVLTTQKCKVAFCLNKRYRKQRQITFLAVGAVAQGLCVWWLGATAWILLPFILHRAIFRPDNPLRVKRVKGKQFWLDGCGREFLEACKSEYGSYQ